jgi:hypothetical protein
MPRGLFDDDAVGPLHQRDKDCRVAELGSPLIQICFRDPTGPGAGPSGKNGDMFVDNFSERFAEWGPANRENR